MGAFDRERWKAVSPYFDRAMELDGAERAEWLDSLRAERPSIAADLDLLLADQDALEREGFLEDSAPLRPAPTSVGPYRLLRLLGEGGMGEVHLAEQREPIRRQVALKLVRPGLDSAKVLARFAVERQILANLHHPGISNVHDAGTTEDGRPYVAMEYVDGPELTQFCDAGRLPVRRRLELFLQVCAAIQHAHQKGVIHRDVKPSNLLVSVVDGHPLVKVIDFGIAKALQPTGDEMLLTHVGMTLGTPEYMSPEQADPAGGDVDTRSDVYSLGVVLYELLVGVRPFEARDLRRPTPLALLEVVRWREPPRLTERLRGLGGAAAEVAAARGCDAKHLLRQLRGELEWITLRALEKQPSRRYASAAELAAEVERHLHGEPVLAGPPSTVYRLRKLVLRHRLAAGGLVVVLLTIVAGGVVSTLSLGRAVRAEHRAREQLRESLLSQARALTSGAELDRRARALTSLGRAAEIRPGLDLRNAALAALSAPGFRLVRRFSPFAGGAVSAWPDTRLTRYACGNPDGSISVRSIDDDAEELRLPPVSVVADYGMFSPDGAWLAVDYHDEELRLWNLAAGTSRPLLKPVKSYRFTPDGRALLASSRDRVHVFDLTTWSELRQDQAELSTDAWPAVHPTEPLFLVPSYGQGWIEIRRASDGTVERHVAMPPLGLAAQWSADGRSLITAHEDFSIRVWDWPSLQAPRLVLRYHGAEPTTLATDPSGRFLATGGWDNQIGVFDLYDGRLLLNQPGTRVNASADRSAFLLVNGAEWSWIEYEPPFALETVAIHDREKSPHSLAFSPDGRLLATAGPDGIRLLDLRSREVTPLVEGEAAIRVAFTSDSSALHAVTWGGLRAWRLTANAPADRVLCNEQEPTGTAPTTTRDRGIATVSHDGQRWIAAGRDARTGHESWIAGRFDSADVTSTEGFAPESNEPELSDDGRWVAWGNWHGHDAAIARVGQQQPPVEFPVSHSASVAISPNSRRLVVGGSEDVRFYEIDTWRPLFTIPRRPTSGIPPSFAFTRDSRLCAMSLTDRVLVIDADTGEEIGSLPAPQHILAGLAFSPDGRRLAVTSTNHRVLLWDFALLRRELGVLGLDWDDDSAQNAR